MPLFTMFGTIMALMVGLSPLNGLFLLPPLLLTFGPFRQTGANVGRRRTSREPSTELIEGPSGLA